MRTQKRIQNGLEVLQYYTTRPWFFHNDKIKKLYEELNDDDKRVFYTDKEHIDWNDYILKYILGARKYCIHEEPDTIPYARRMLKRLLKLMEKLNGAEFLTNICFRLYYLDVAKNILLVILFLWAISSLFLSKSVPVTVQKI